MRVTKHVEFEAAHVLPGYDGGCGNLHGHTYKIEVTVEGPQDEAFGFVLDFKDLKKAIEEVVPDHRFIFKKGNIMCEDIAAVLDQYNIKYVRYDFDTTAENMVGYFAEMIQDYLQNELGYSEDIKVVEVKLYETTNSFATWKKDNAV